MELKFKKTIVTLPEEGKTGEWQLKTGKIVAMAELFGMPKCKPSYRGRLFKIDGDGAYIEIPIKPRHPELLKGNESYFASSLGDIQGILKADGNITAEKRRIEKKENDAAREAVIPKRKDIDG